MGRMVCRWEHKRKQRVGRVILVSLPCAVRAAHPDSRAFYASWCQSIMGVKSS